MTNRVVSIVFLFFAAMATSGLALALGLSLAVRAGGAPGPWLMPVVMFVSFVAVFFLGREAVLPSAYSGPAWALGFLSVWMGLTLVMAGVVIWAVRPLLPLVGVDSANLPIVFGCMLVSVAILDRVASRIGRRALP